MMHYRLMAAAAALIVALVLPSAAQTPQGVKVGTLTCRLAPSIGLLIGSQQRMSCVFQPDGGYPPEQYAGCPRSRLGLDIGISAGGVMAWAVYAPSSGPLRGALARYLRRRQRRNRWRPASVSAPTRSVRRLGEYNLATAALAPRHGEPPIVALGVAALTLRWCPVRSSAPRIAIVVRKEHRHQ